MANLIEANEYPAGIYQLEQDDPVLGGAPNEATGAGMDNIPHLQLAKRTNWLKVRVDQLLAKAIAASTQVAGLVRLSNATNSTSVTEAATPLAVKTVMDSANTRALKSTSVTTAGLATGGGTLEANLSINVPIATQEQAEAGIVDTRAMTPMRVTQAIAARLAGRRIDGAGLAVGGGSLSADRTITVPASTQAQAQAGTDHSTAMTPLRVMQAIAQQHATRSHSLNGYQVLPGGLILQWGYAAIDASGTLTVTFPLAFPAACWSAILTDNALSASGTHTVSVSDISRFGFRAFAAFSSGNPASTAFYYMAIGN